MKKIFLLLLVSVSSFAQSGFGNNAVYQFSSYDVDYQKVLSYAQQQGIKMPSIACMNAQNTLMQAIKSNIGLSAFDQIKVMYADAPSDFTLINWVNPSILQSIQRDNIPYVNLNGWTNGFPTVTAGALDMGVLGGQYTLNNAENIIYYSGLTANYGVLLDGTKGNANNPSYSSISPTQSAASGGTVQIQINDTNFTNVTGFDLTDGLYYFGRTAASGAGSIFLRKGSAARVTASSASNGLSPFGFTLGGYSITANGYTGYGSTPARKFYLFTSGRLLTTTEEADFKTAWDTYMTSISAITPPSTIGTIYSKSTFTNLADFTNNGATVTATSNQLQFTGGTNTFTQTLDLTSVNGTAIGATMLNRWTQTFTFIVPTITASTNWIGIGLRSSNSGGGTNLYDLVFRMDLTTGTSGVMRLYVGPSHTLAASTSALTVTTGDVVSMTLELKDGVALYSGYNVTTSSSVISGSYSLFGNSGGYVTNTGHFAIFDGGGSVNTNKVTSWTVSSGEIQNPDYAIIGDSKTQGYTPSGNNLYLTIRGAYAYLLERKLGKIVNLGGSSDASTDYVARMYEVINFVRPKNLIIAGVSNDIRRGVANATWQANINSVISQAQAAGINVIFWTGMYEAVMSQAAVSTWANAGIGCKVWDSLVITLSNNPDNIHPDGAGHALFAASALSYGLLQK